MSESSADSENCPTPSLVNAAHLNQQVLEALAKRSAPAAFAYLVLLPVILLATGLFRSHWVLSLAAMAWLGFVGCLRLHVARSFPSLPARAHGRWERSFGALALVAGSTWGLGCAVWTFERGLGHGSVIVLVALAGTSAGAVTSLGPSLRLLRAYLVCMLVPTVVVMALLGDSSVLSWGFAVLLLIYLGFLTVEGRHVRDGFVLAVAHSTLLENRATELHDRARSMKLVLDSVGQGFLNVAPDGVMSSERSAILSRWFGDAIVGEKLWSYLGRTDQEFARWIELGFESLESQILPIDLVVDQLPRRMSFAGFILSFEYRPLMRGANVETVLLVVTDITGEVQRERSESDKLEMMAAFEQLVRDRAGFQDFFSEAEGLLATIAAPDCPVQEMRRALHTLKGNCGSFGLTRLAATCHALETLHSQTGEPLSANDMRSLQICWRSAMGQFDTLLGDFRKRLDVSRDEYQTLARAIRSGVPRAELSQLLDGWLRRPTALRLARIAHHVPEMASRLGKEPISLSLESNDLHLPSVEWSGFWGAFLHLVRNAIVHGIESADERLRSGKSASGRIALSTRLDNDEFVVSAEDDGRGIDWARVVARAKAMNLPHGSTQELEAVLFHDGVSTSDSVTTDAGRGVGMGAILAVTRSLGGRIEIWSEAGKGTRCSARFPCSVLGIRAGV